LASIEIHSVETVSGNQPRVRRIIEEASQTFLPGTPVEIASDGGVEEWDGSTLADKIAGFSLEAGQDLASLGVQPSAAVVGPQPLTFGSVPNETSAENIGRPAFSDGRNGFEVATQDTVFRGQVGPSQSVTAANVGIQYGLTKDSDGHWYVDTSKTTTNAVVEVVKLDPWDQSTTRRGVWFVVLPAAAQLIA
jgi:hypothetical protein